MKWPQCYTVTNRKEGLQSLTDLHYKHHNLACLACDSFIACTFGSHILATGQSGCSWPLTGVALKLAESKI